MSIFKRAISGALLVLLLAGEPAMAVTGSGNSSAGGGASTGNTSPGTGPAGLAAKVASEHAVASAKAAADQADKILKELGDMIRFLKDSFDKLHDDKLRSENAVKDCQRDQSKRKKEICEEDYSLVLGFWRNDIARRGLDGLLKANPGNFSTYKSNIAHQVELAKAAVARNVLPTDKAAADAAVQRALGALAASDKYLSDLTPYVNAEKGYVEAVSKSLDTLDALRKGL